MEEKDKRAILDRDMVDEISFSINKIVCCWDKTANNIYCLARVRSYTKVNFES